MDQQGNELCRTCGINITRNNRTTCEGCFQLWRQRRQHTDAEAKQNVMHAYGGKCKCCGEDRIAFLTLHHEQSDGAFHRLLLGTQTGASFYRRLEELNFPTDTELSVLCANCHTAITQSGICPHAAISMGDQGSSSSPPERLRADLYPQRQR